MTAHDQREQVVQSASRLSLEDRTEYPSHDAVQLMMAEVAKQTAEGILKGLGIDASNPLSAQQDFAKLRVMRKLMEDDGFVADLAFIRRLRLNTDRITDTGIRSFVRWAVVGLLGFILLVSKDWWIVHFRG